MFWHSTQLSQKYKDKTEKIKQKTEQRGNLATIQQKKPNEKDI